VSKEERSVERDRSIRLGISPLSWVNEVLEDLGRGTTAQTCLKEAAAAGYEGVELSRIFPRDPAQLSGLLSRHGLQFISGWHSGFLADRDVAKELEAVREHARLLADCGAAVMVYGECGSMVAETLDETSAVMAATGPSVGLLLDTGHAAAAGFDYVRLIEEFVPRINHVHLKDVRGDVFAEARSRDMCFNDAVRAGIFTVPGDGMVDFAPLARFLKESPYSGWLVVEAEQDPTKAPPAETVKRAFDFVNDRILQSARRADSGGLK
jgi:inosose dehydratase